MIKSQEKVIDGIAFQTTQFPAFPAIEMKIRLGKMFAPALLRVLSAGSLEEVEAKLANANIGTLLPGVETFLAGLQPGQFPRLCLDLLQHTTGVVGKGDAAEKVEIASEAAFNQVFSDNLMTVYKVGWWVLGVNNFFGFGGIGKAMAKMSATKTPTTPASKPPQAS